MTPSSQVDVSVVVPVRNAAGEIDGLLAALHDQTLAPDRFEVIIVDDDSTDGTADAVGRDRRVRLVRAESNGGSYRARNLGLTIATAPVLAFTDADCRPARDWLERGLEALEHTGADLIAGHVEMPLGARPSAAALVDYARHLDQERAVSDGFGATANLWVRRAVVERVGVFNDNLISGGDTEFGHRAVARGMSLVYAAEVIVVHPPRATKSGIARKCYRLGYGAAQQRYHAEGPLRSRPHICMRPGAYIPHRQLYGVERLAREGVTVSFRRGLSMRAVAYLWGQLPMVAGNFVATLRERRHVPGAAEPAPVIEPVGDRTS